MSDTIIEINNLSKQYRLGLVSSRTLSSDLQRWVARMRGKEDPFLKIGEENKLDTIQGQYIWALQNINLEVNKGEVLGIIGKNGAGKSTLLKILSRVTGPTTGTIKAKGRIASLLEVGTGFHPELTGKENIFLNGAILGMTKSEIKRKLDEIVDFAGVAKYIDTPVKRYSSGMYVRLAFAVAAHLDPEILIVDEVLAVGDAEFQKKAIGKMKDVSKNEGRTVLFVSHNMAAVERICSKAVLLKNGSISEIGSASEIVQKYLKESRTEIENVNGIHSLKHRSQHLKEVRTYANNISSYYVSSGESFKIQIDFEDDKVNEFSKIGIVIRNYKDDPIIGINNNHYNTKLFNKPTPKGTFEITFQEFPLFGEGIYSVDLYLGNGFKDYETIENAFTFYLKDTDILKGSQHLMPEINKVYLNKVHFTGK